MAPIVSEIVIARPPAEVFAYAIDPERFGEWQGGVVAGHTEPAGPPGIGSHCIMTRRIGGSERTSTSVITELSPPRTWAIHGIDGPIRADVAVTVEPRQDGTQSHVTIQLDFSGSGMGKVILPMVVRQARKEVPQSCQNLKNRLESHLSSPRVDWRRRSARAGSALPAAPARARSVPGGVAPHKSLSRAAYGLVARSKRSASSRA
jgi:uncharacterized protein YndB with AHSA1/START domain